MLKKISSIFKTEADLEHEAAKELEPRPSNLARKIQERKAGQEKAKQQKSPTKQRRTEKPVEKPKVQEKTQKVQERDKKTKEAPIPAKKPQKPTEHKTTSIALDKTKKDQPKQVHHAQHHEIPKVDPKLKSLLKWFDENDIWYDDEVLEIKTVGNQGYGVYAKEDIPEDSVISSIPKAAILSIKNTGIADVFESEELGGGVALALAIMFERSKGKDSPWYGYLESLPKREETLLFWSDDELKELQGTDVLEVIKEDKLYLQHDYDELVRPILDKYPAYFSPKDRNTFYSFESFLNASSLVSSRAFQVDDYHGDSMVPLADIYNHLTDKEHVHMETDQEVCGICGAPEGTCHHGDDNSDVEMTDVKHKRSDSSTTDEGWATDDEEIHPALRLDMRTIRKVEKGEQVYNTYGHHSNGALLHKYGFCDEEVGTNTHDTFSVNVEDVIKIAGHLLGDKSMQTAIQRAGIWWQWKDLFNEEEESEPMVEAESLAEWVHAKGQQEEKTDLMFEFKSDMEVEPSLVLLLLLLDAEEEDVPNLSRHTKTNFNRVLEMVEAAENDGIPERLQDAVAEILRQRLAKYPTTLEQDQDILAVLEPFTKKKHALIARMGEKMLANEFIEEYANGALEEALTAMADE